MDYQTNNLFRHHVYDLTSINTSFYPAGSEALPVMIQRPKCGFSTEVHTVCRFPYLRPCKTILFKCSDKFVLNTPLNFLWSFFFFLPNGRGITPFYSRNWLRLLARLRVQYFDIVYGVKNKRCQNMFRVKRKLCYFTCSIEVRVRDVTALHVILCVHVASNKFIEYRIQDHT